MAIGKVSFIKKWEESSDQERLALLEGNPQLKMTVMLDEEETTVVCENDDEVFLRFDYCQGNHKIIGDILGRLHIKYERVQRHSTEEK